jgi:hypothetical protein
MPLTTTQKETLFSDILDAENRILITFIENLGSRYMANERILSENDHIIFFSPVRYNKLDGQLLLQIQTRLREIKLLADKVAAQNQELESRRFETRDSLTQNKLKFRLSGMTRRAVNEFVRENPSAKDGLAEFYQTILNERPQSSSRKTKKRRQ